MQKSKQYKSSSNQNISNGNQGYGTQSVTAQGQNSMPNTNLNANMHLNSNNPISDYHDHSTLLHDAPVNEDHQDQAVENFDEMLSPFEKDNFTEDLDQSNLILTKALENFRPLDWIQDQVFLKTPVANITGYYPLIKLSKINQQANYLRPFGEISSNDTSALDYHHYECKNYAISGQVEEETIFESKMNPLSYLVELVKQSYFRLSLQREIKASTLLQNKDHYYSSHFKDSASEKWSDDSVKIVDQILEAKKKIISQTSFSPNILVLSFDVYQKIQGKTELMNYIKYTGEGKIDLLSLARILGLDKVIVGQTFYTNSSSSSLPIWENSASLLFIPKDKTLPSFSRAFQKNLYPKAYKWKYLEGGRIYSHAVVDSYQLSILNPELGFLFKNLV